MQAGLTHPLERGLQTQNAALIAEGVLQVKLNAPEPGTLSTQAQQIADLARANLSEWSLVEEDGELTCVITQFDENGCAEAASILELLPWQRVRLEGKEPQLIAELLTPLALLPPLQHLDMSRWRFRKETGQFLGSDRTRGLKSLSIYLKSGCSGIKNFSLLVPGLERLVIKGTPGKRMVNHLGLLPLTHLTIRPHALSHLPCDWVTALFGRPNLRELNLTGFDSTVTAVRPLVDGNQQLNVTISEVELIGAPAPAPVSPRRRWSRKKEAGAEFVPLSPRGQCELVFEPTHPRVTVVGGWGS